MKETLKEKALRTTISITPSILRKAEEVMNARSFSDFSGMLHQLIREEYERRVGREAYMVNALAEAIGVTPDEIRGMIDARLPQAERELRRKKRGHAKVK